MHDCNWYNAVRTLDKRFLAVQLAVNLWGLDAIKTKGESVAIVLYLVGARPVREGTGRVARFELIPLEELGRPRMVQLPLLTAGPFSPKWRGLPTCGRRVP